MSNGIISDYRGNINNKQLEDNENLKFPKSVYIYAKMLREDSRVSAIYKNISLHIKSTKWFLRPNGCDQDILNMLSNDLGLDVMDNNGDLINEGETRTNSFFQEHLHWALLSIVYGCMFFEQIYEVGEDGKERLKKLAPRMPQSLSRIKVGDDGVFDGIYQKVNGFNNNEEVFIPKDRLVAYIYDPQDLSWTGSSILRPSYSHWILKNELQKLEFSALDRNSMGIPVYTASELTDKADRENEIQEGGVIAESLRNGDNAGISVPPGAKMSIIGISGQIASPREAIKYHDNKISEASLTNYMNLEGGSYNLADVQKASYIQSLQTTAKFICDTFTEYVIKDLLELYGYEGPIPSLSFDPIGTLVDISPVDIAQLVNADVIEMDEMTEEFLRRKWGLNKKPTLQERAELRKKRQEVFGTLNVQPEAKDTKTEETSMEDNGKDNKEIIDNA